MLRPMESESLEMGPRELILKKKRFGSFSCVSGVETTNVGKLTRPEPETNCFPGTIFGRSNTRL